MNAKILNIPISNISDVKRSPMDVFKKADKEDKGVYIFNRNQVAGVMLTQKQYESFNEDIDNLYDLIAELTAEKRLLSKDVKFYSDEDVRGSIVNETPIVDESDGWE
ncbi:MAG: hypothetical protein GX864_04655 [Mollicutes bacterium]|jgi:PHD/YefM family antitoxin component YafN of YafNO toxin-antitoxin module|nr:hypothetical protein [Mollicutes bacterium]